MNRRTNRQRLAFLELLSELRAEAEKQQSNNTKILEEDDVVNYTGKRSIFLQKWDMDDKSSSINVRMKVLDEWKIPENK